MLLTGNIDLSGGSIIAFVCMFLSKLMKDTNLSVGVIVLLSLIVGAAFGLIQGYLIAYFSMQSFIVTLAGQFVARGATALLSVDTIDIERANYVSLSSLRIPLFEGYISLGSVIAVVVLIIGTVMLHKTKTGRKLYAVGGNRQSAELMGIDSKKVIMKAYIVSGFLAALSAICYSLIMLSGYTLHGVGMEMEAISSSVIGGTMLSGGVAFLPGTLFGVLIQGTIQTLITFQGTLSAWWTKIVIAILLCLSIVIQTLLNKSRQKQ